MPKLIPSKKLLKKLNRLKTPVGELNYLGNDPNLLVNAPIVAVVGTRKPTPYGKHITEKLVGELVRAGVVIVSGLAFGVDIISHKSALEERGVTISILPSGLDNIYPASHRNIAKKIMEKGCLLSEYPSNHMPRKVEFLERNRIIASLSDIVIIPEAADRSGSLNTASHAKSMGIMVCALPGQATSPMSQGTNQLIKSGDAKIITCAQDVLDLLNVKLKPKKILGSNDQETAILEAISSGIVDSTQLQRELQIDTKLFQTQMTMLEIDGRVCQDEIGNWQIK